MVFLKTCYNCGAKAKTLQNGMCENCFREETPPVKEIKELNLKICNSCKKIHYNNALMTQEEIAEILPQAMKKRVVMNEGYKLKDVKIDNLEFDKNKVLFDVRIESELTK